MSKTRKLILYILIATLLIVSVVALSACTNANFEIDKEGLHAGDPLPEVICDQAGTVSWIGDTVVKGGVHNYTFSFTDVFGKRTEYTVQLTATDHLTDGATSTVLDPPTCEEMGMRKHLCTICGEQYSLESIPALGHDFTEYTHVDGDCQTKGYFTTTCSRCGEEFLDENGEPVRTYDANFGPHDYQKTDITLPTCVQDGTYKYKCEVCQEYQRYADGEIYVHHDGILDPDNHVYRIDPVSKEEITETIIHPTCQEEGLGYISCILCDGGKEVILERTTHSFKVVSEASNPGDCHHYGYTIYKCAYDGCDELERVVNEDGTLGEVVVHNHNYYGPHHYVDGKCDVRYQDEDGVWQICGDMDIENVEITFNIGANEKGSLPTSLVVASLIPREPESVLDSNVYYDMFITGEGGVYQHFGSSELFPWYVLDVTFETNAGLYYRDLIKSVTIVDGVTDLAKYMFQNFAQLEEVTFCSTLGGGGGAIIPAYCFADNDRLDTMNNIPSNTVSIEERAFYNCPLLNFNTFGLPTDLEYIGKEAFAYNIKLLNLDFRRTPNLKYVGNNAFYECKNLAYVIMPSVLRELEIGGGAFLMSEPIIYIEDVYSSGWDEMAVFSTAYVYYLGSTLDSAFDDMVKIYSDRLQVIHNPNGEEITVSYRDLYSNSKVRYTVTGNVITRALRFTESAVNPSGINTWADLMNQTLSNGTTFGSNLQLIGPEAVATTKFVDTNRGYVESLAIPSTVKVICDLAFSQTTLVGLQIPQDSQLEVIGSEAFADIVDKGSLDLFLPSTLTKVVPRAFMDTVFRNVVIDMKVIPKGTDSGGLLFSPHSDGGFVTLTLGPNVETISDYAFAELKNMQTVTSLTIPESVNYVGKGAFLNCSYIQEFVLPNKPIEIGVDAFKGTACYTQNTTDGVTRIGNHIIKATGLTGAYDIAEGVITLADEAFYGCVDLTVTLPSTLEHIGKKALDGVTIASDIDDVYVGTKLVRAKNTANEYVVNYGTTDILSGVFKGNTTLTTIKLPDTLVNISDEAFSGCANLTTVIFVDQNGNESLSKIKTIGDDAFYECVKLAHFDFGNQLESLGAQAFVGCLALDEIVLPDTLQAIPARCFWDCTDAKLIKIGNGVKSIDIMAFAGCKNAEEIYIGSGVTSIHTGAFRTRALKELHLASLDNWLAISFTKNQTLQWGASFMDGYSNNPAMTSKVLVDYYVGESLLENFVADSSLKKIGSYSLGNCNSLKSVQLDFDVVAVGGGAFYRCYNVKTVNANRSAWNDISDEELSQKVYDSVVPSFFGVGANPIINVTRPGGATAEVKGAVTFNIYDTSLYKITSVGVDDQGVAKYALTIADCVEIIPADCLQFYFEHFGGWITELTIPHTVKEIKDRAFDGMGEEAYISKIEKIVIVDTAETPSQLTTIGEHGFYGIATESINIPSSVKRIGVDGFAATYTLKKVIIKDINAWASINFATEPGNNSISVAGSNPLHTGAYSWRVEDYGDVGLYLVDEMGFETLVEEATISVNVGQAAFFGCQHLKKLTLTASVGTVGDRAFQHCNSLTELYLETDSKERDFKIGNYAFDRTNSATIPLKIHVENDTHLWIELGYLASNGSSNNETFAGAWISREVYTKGEQNG